MSYVARTTFRLLALKSCPLGAILHARKTFEWRECGFPDNDIDGVLLCSSQIDNGQYGAPCIDIIPNAVHVLCHVTKVGKVKCPPHPGKPYRLTLADAFVFNPPIPLNTPLNVCLMYPNTPALVGAVAEVRRRTLLYVMGLPGHGSNPFVLY